MLSVGVDYFEKDDFASSAKFYHDAFETGKVVKDSIIQSKALLNLGMVYNNQARYDEAIENYYCHLSIGNILRKQKTPSQAIESYNNALKIFTEMNDERGVCACYNNVGISYFEMDNYERGLEYYNKALDIYMKNGQKKNVASMYSNIAALYEHLKDYDKAIEYVQKSLEIGVQNQSPSNLMGAFTNLAGIYLSKIQDNPEILDTHPGYLDTVIKYGTKGMELADSMQLILEEVSTLKILKDAYSLKGNYPKAFELSDKLMELNDSVYNSEKTKIIAEAHNKYEAEKNKQEISRQKHEIEDQQLELSNTRLFRNLLAAISLLLIVLVVLIFYDYRKNKKAHRILDEKNTLIENQNKEIIAQKNELQDANQKLSELIQFKEKMTGMIVHDLKNSINNILNSQFIDDIEFREQIIKQAGYDMLNLVQNILDVYKLDEAKIQIFPEQVLIRPILEECIMELSLYVSKKNLTIVYPENEAQEINADKKLMKRIFSNLLSNAVKYSMEGKSITIKTWANEQSGNCFSVHNIGPVIPKEKQNYIFQQFNKYESRDMGMAVSTGLGLSFCKMAVELHGGEIGVNSEECGTEFWFCIPGQE